jgi:hypothetical protein
MGKKNGGRFASPHGARRARSGWVSVYYMQKVRFVVSDAAARSSWARECARSCLRALVHALVAICCSSAFADNHTSPPWRVVMLYGSDYMLPAVVMHNQALQRTLDAGSQRRIDIYSDAVDAQRFDGHDLEPAFLALMRKKYAGMRVDLVVAGNQFAHDFAQRHRAELWPRARLLLHNSPEHILRGRQLAPGDLVVPIRFDFDGTIELATRLQPDARQIVIVGGVSDRDRLWRRGIAEAANRRASRQMYRRLPYRRCDPVHSSAHPPPVRTRRALACLYPAPAP